VHVLEHEHGGRPPAQLAGERRHHLVRHRPTLQDRPELAAGLVGDGQQRPEGAAGEQRVAAAPEDPRRPAGRLAESPQQRRLADPGLPADQQDLPTRAALDGLETIDQHRQLGGAFEQDTRHDSRW
jgi:hypothetical protein